MADQSPTKSYLNVQGLLDLPDAERREILLNFIRKAEGEETDEAPEPAPPPKPAT
jgi:hypothetical protein